MLAHLPPVHFSFYIHMCLPGWRWLPGCLFSSSLNETERQIWDVFDRLKDSLPHPTNEAQETKAKRETKPHHTRTIYIDEDQLA